MPPNFLSTAPVAGAPEPYSPLRELQSFEQQGDFLRSIANDAALPGATLLRGTNIGDDAAFEQFVRRATPDLLDYDYASTPRSRVSGKIYTSTEYPKQQSIPQHNEMSYASNWPRILWFCCLQPAESGGATPLSDSRTVYQLIPERIRRTFEDRGVLYRRTFNTGLDLTWQQAFGTETRADVEKYCHQASMSFRWSDGNMLHTEQRRPAVMRHPKTGESCWFNQAHLFHPSSLSPEVRELLLDVVGPDDLPRTALYGDGTPIEDDSLTEIRNAYDHAQFQFEWQRGDVLALDNVAYTHGRTPFSGTRRVLVAMA